jgi:hypothetical protein
VRGDADPLHVLLRLGRLPRSSRAALSDAIERQKNRSPGETVRFRGSPAPVSVGDELPWRSSLPAFRQKENG